MNVTQEQIEVACDPCPNCNCGRLAAIATIERCAREADNYKLFPGPQIAAAIRALKP